MADEKKEKVRRIKGKFYNELSAKNKAINKAKEAWEMWLETQAEMYNIYIDQLVEPLRGKYLEYEDAEVQGNQIVPIKPKVKRLPHTFVKEAKVKSKLVENAVENRAAFLLTLSSMHNTWPDCIDPATGIIRDNDFVRAEENEHVMEKEKEVSDSGTEK